MQISYERLNFQASNRPQHSFKRLHRGLKNIRSAYERHISRPQPHGLKTAATWLSMTPRFCLEGSEGGIQSRSREGPGGFQGASRGGLEVSQSLRV